LPGTRISECWWPGGVNREALAVTPVGKASEQLRPRSLSGPELAAEVTKAGLASPISSSSVLRILAEDPCRASRPVKGRLMDTRRTYGATHLIWSSLLLSLGVRDHPR
jgi:hypothetical protein